MAAARANLLEVLTPEAYAHLDHLNDRILAGCQAVIEQAQPAGLRRRRRLQGLRHVLAGEDRRLRDVQGQPGRRPRRARVALQHEPRHLHDAGPRGGVDAVGHPHRRVASTRTSQVFEEMAGGADGLSCLTSWRPERRPRVDVGRAGRRGRPRERPTARRRGMVDAPSIAGPSRRPSRSAPPRRRTRVSDCGRAGDDERARALAEQQRLADAVEVDRGAEAAGEAALGQRDRERRPRRRRAPTRSAPDAHGLADRGVQRAQLAEVGVRAASPSSGSPRSLASSEPASAGAHERRRSARSRRPRPRSRGGRRARRRAARRPCRRPASGRSGPPPPSL